MKIKKFNVGTTGLDRFFGPLEAKIMNVLWDAEHPLTIKEVQQSLDHEKSLSFNTVMTVMNRLVEKGALQKQMEGKSFHYVPLESREDFLDHQSRELTHELMEEFGSLAVNHMVDVLEEVDPKLIQALEDKIRQWKNNG
ncbi:BlaI/MecI/CopY family transcriptional regulator [Paenibacillus hunanensis]|uniref:Transcriptional regulator n=1 Tax=Paenibacillus hunanensis TaxID=539262 RepID=A0ABU1IU23_9BACL|nr:BlaI/MecI/CopY family transcriptional regulator [Paenibacillus hunanensis]MCL9661731.1 BlaI/MecI/CopY family transcriptional regulator [Paenibacillus hunanensis]MDR6242728.1 putative transcriptional regulator [Paenibacillus hunanensis]WPP41900.1 BlaI/MecI/CopY family transcriptional regulator [Paenibacillus hunanensis]GGJ02272.1 transcriptional regulator [Paenibacillus hunanensis]